MQATSAQNHKSFDLETQEISVSLAELRLVNPREQRRVDESLKVYGQISPIVVLESASAPFELIDGFKRLRAAITLNIPTLRARTLAVGKHAAKAAVINLNRATGRVTDLEEAFAISSLARDDGLTQKEIALLFGRHRSWVSRRLAMTERTCNEVQEAIRLGLLSPAKAREIGKVPRGTQPDLLKSLQDFSLTSRETARLVAHLLSQPQSSWEETLKFPEKILDAKPAKSTSSKSLEEALARCASYCRSITKRLKDTNEVSVEAVDACRYTAGIVSRTASELRRLVRRGGEDTHD